MFKMWTIEASRITTASKEQIWKFWVDVPNWNLWDADVETAELFGKFQIETKGILKPVGGPKAKFKISELTELQSFTSSSFLPFCKMDFIHTMTETNDGLEVKHKIEMKGFLAFLFSKMIGNNIKVGLPKAVETLVRLAEKAIV